MAINITSIFNPSMTGSNTQFIDVVMRVEEMGDIPCTLGMNDYTSYMIKDNDTGEFVPTTNHDLYVQATAGVFGNVTPFTLNLGYAKTQVVQAITNGCDSITSQVIPSQTKQLAYQNALMILSMNNNVPPSSGPNATLFTNLALTWGMSAANFAGLILSMQTLSLNLATLEITFQSLINNAVSANQLLAELNMYESAIDTLVHSVNALVPIPIDRPAHIIVKGLNS